MAVYLEAGFDIADVGSMSVNFTESGGGGAQTATVSSATYCHTALTSVLGSNNYDAFATELKSKLEAASAGALTYTVTWSRTAGTYTISPSAGTVSLDFTTPGDPGTRMRRTLGFSANQSTAASHTSDVTPYYYVAAANPCKSNVSDDYEPDGIIEQAEGDDGTPYSVHRTTAAVYSDFDLTTEARAAVFTRAAPDGTTAGDTPWTYQHLWQHCRGRTPINVTDSNESSVSYLRNGSFRPTRMIADYDGYWALTFETNVVGRL